MIPSDLSPLANHLWQSTLFVVAAWLLTLALKKNRAAVRYWLWLAASVKFLIPFSLLVSIGSQFGWRTTPAIVQPQWSSVIDDVGYPFAAVSTPAIQAAVPPASSPIPAILLGVWLCGCAVSVFFWLRCWRRVRTARHGAAPLALDLPIRVLSSRSLIEPGIFGDFRPVLLLPEGITDRLTSAQLDAVVAHEMCHVRRRDNLTAAIHMVVETVFWFHPLVWWIRMRLVEERERACDEYVLKSGSDPEVYAEGILNVCKFYLESPLTCVSGVTGSDLKKRMERIMSNRVGETLNRWRKLLLALAVAVALAGPVVFGLVNAPQIRAQSPQTASGGPLLSFEVASIKLNKSSVNTTLANIPSFFSSDTANVPATGLLTFTHVGLRQLVHFAYKLTIVESNRLMFELPKGIDEERFDIQARADGTPGTDQVRLMMQSLLADRFKLVLHHETRDLPVFELVLSKNGKTGPQLMPHLDPKKCVDAPGAPATRAQVTGATPLIFLCGQMQWFNLGTKLDRFTGGNITMPMLADNLGNCCFERPVVDRTGLSGSFDIFVDTVRPGSAESADVSEAPPITTALKEQLGLRLESTKAPVDVLVIDHIEEPSPN